MVHSKMYESEIATSRTNAHLTGRVDRAPVTDIDLEQQKGSIRSFTPLTGVLPRMRDGPIALGHDDALVSIT